MRFIFNITTMPIVVVTNAGGDDIHLPHNDDDHISFSSYLISKDDDNNDDDGHHPISFVVNSNHFRPQLLGLNLDISLFFVHPFCLFCIVT
mmetsp:Transcript_27666/g.41162  ORF Transcript_27666/g.41162 Transcript_27666/m.41162 type:complete len:91 (+) Transcript_27666:2424-2696(+)